MVKFKVALKDLLGKAYYRYNILNDITNGTKGETNTIQCTVTNIFGNPVSDKEVTLYAQGTEVSTKTTNALGYVEWEIPLNNADLRLYQIDTHSTYTLVKNGGWKTYTPTINSYTTLYYNDDTRTAELRYIRDFTSASADTFYTWHTGAIPQNYRPSRQVNGSFNQVGVLYVDSNGDIGGKFANGWNSDRRCIGTVIWHY